MKFRVYDVETEDLGEPMTDSLERADGHEVEANSSHAAAQGFLEYACDEYEDGERGDLLVVTPSVTSPGEQRREIYSFHYEIRIRYNVRRKR